VEAEAGRAAVDVRVVAAEAVAAETKSVFRMKTIAKLRVNRVNLAGKSR
jgi:hypothetical protein